MFSVWCQSRTPILRSIKAYVSRWHRIVWPNCRKVNGLHLDSAFHTFTEPWRCGSYLLILSFIASKAEMMNRLNYKTVWSKLNWSLFPLISLLLNVGSTAVFHTDAYYDAHDTRVDIYFLMSFYFRLFVVVFKKLTNGGKLDPSDPSA